MVIQIMMVGKMALEELSQSDRAQKLRVWLPAIGNDADKKMLKSFY